jgi:hypothetical protein
VGQGCNGSALDLQYGRVLVEVFKDHGKRAESPKQLTVTMFSIIVLQLLKLQIPFFLFHRVIGIEIKFNFVELHFPFKIHSTFFQDGTLRLDPSAQLWVKAVASCHYTCNAGREERGVLVEGYSSKMTVRRGPTAQIDSQ